MNKKLINQSNLAENQKKSKTSKIKLPDNQLYSTLHNNFKRFFKD